MSKFTQSFKGDKTIWIVALILGLISMLAVFSSTYSLSLVQSSPFYFLGKHAMILFAGFMVMYVVQNIPVSKYRDYAFIALIIGICLLVSMFFYKSGNNLRAVRWTKLPIIGEFQPADFVKVIMVVYLAKVLGTGEVKSFQDLCVRVFLPVGIVILLVIRGHISGALMMGCTYALIIFISDTKPKYMGITAAAIVLFGLAFVFFGEYISDRTDTAESRVGVHRGQSDDDSKSDQSDKAKIAVASGGFFGKGPGNSDQRKVMSESFNDYIYAIIIEEYGIFGGLVVMLLYLILFYRVILIAKQCTLQYPMLLIVGLISVIMIQALVHMGVSVGAIPVTGQTLPLLSMGGTSVLMTCIALGMILSVSRAVKNNELHAEVMPAEAPVPETPAEI